jgi:hypothetical protein
MLKPDCVWKTFKWVDDINEENKRVSNDHIFVLILHCFKQGLRLLNTILDTKGEKKFLTVKKGLNSNQNSMDDLGKQLGEKSVSPNNRLHTIQPASLPRGGAVTATSPRGREASPNEDKNLGRSTSPKLGAHNNFGVPDLNNISIEEARKYFRN